MTSKSIAKTAHASDTEDTSEIDKMITAYQDLRLRLLDDQYRTLLLLKNAIPREMKGLKHSLLRATPTDRANILKLGYTIIEMDETVRKEPIKDEKEYEAKTIVRRPGKKDVNGDEALNCLDSLAFCGDALRTVEDVEVRKTWKGRHGETIAYMKKHEMIPE